MAYAEDFLGSKPKKKPKPKPKKAKPVKATTSIAATLGGKEVEKSRKHAKGPLGKKITAAALGVPKSEVASKKEAKKNLRKARRKDYTGPTAQKLTAKRYARGIKARTETPDKDYTLFKDKKGRIRDFEEFAPQGVRVVRALAGDEPGATTPTLGEFAAIGTTLALGGVGKVARAPALAKAGQKVRKAEAAARAAAPATQKVKRVNKARAAAVAEQAEKGTVSLKKLRKYQKAEDAMRAAPSTGRVAKAASKAKQATKARYAKPQRKVRRALRAQKATSRAINPITPGVASSDAGRAFVEGTAKAVTEEPGKTAKTTARAVYGFPAAIAGDALDLATGRFGEFAETQKAYLSTLGKLAEGDPDVVKETITNEVGLVPHITAGLSLYAGARGAVKSTGKKVKVPSRAARQQEKLVREAREGATSAERKAAKREIDTKQGREPAVGAHRRRRQEARRSATAGELEMGMRRLESRKGGKRKVTGSRRRLEEEIRDLDRRQLAEGVTEGDVIQFLGRHRDIDLEGVKRLREDLRKPSRDIDSDEVHTRAVMDAIIANPRVLTDPKVQGVVSRFYEIQHGKGGRSVERHAERTGKPQTAPDPLDARAQFLPVMREKGIRTAEERTPVPLRGKTKVKERAGQNMEKAIRGEARSLTKRASRLEAQAVALRKARPERAQILEERAARYRAEAEARLDVVDRHRRADNLERQAAKTENRAEAAELRAQAEELRDIADAEQRVRLQESLDEAKGVLRAEGRRDPVYFPQTDVTRTERFPVSDIPATRGIKKEKYTKGVLEAEGRIDESAEALLGNFYKARAALTERARARGFVEEMFWRNEGGERLFTGDEITAIRRSGEAPPGYRQVAIQDFAPTIQRTGPLRREVQAKRLATQATQKETRLYGFVPDSSLTEFGAQTKALPGGPLGGLRTVRAIARTQSIVMLAANTAWFTMQLVATPLVIALRNPSPQRWVRAGRNGLDIWRHGTPEERAAFWAHFGGNPSDFLAIGENIRGINPTTIRSFNSAADLALRSPVGRMVNAIWDNTRKGGPLIGLNRRYEAWWRKYEALMEMDRLSGVSPNGRTRAFAASAARLTGVVHRHLKQLKGKRGADQMRAYLSNGKLMRELEDEVNDAIGNWSALTAAEKRLSSVIVFYPFVRFSLAWLAKFPAKNPIKSAAYLNLGQSNAQELAMLLGGDPSFWAGWAQAVTHFGGEPRLVDLSRAVPGGNAIMESIGNDQNPILTTLRMTQPLIGGTIAAGFGKTPWGQEMKGNFGEQVAKNLLSLSPATRWLGEKVGPDPGRISKLFRAIEARNGLERGVLPDALPDIEGEAEAARLSRLLETAYAYDEQPKETEFANGTPEHRAATARKRASQAAWDEIDAMLIKYGVESKADQRKEEEQYQNRRYGPDSSGDNIFSPSSSSGDDDNIFKSSGDSSSGGNIFR